MSSQAHDLQPPVVVGGVAAGCVGRTASSSRPDVLPSDSTSDTFDKLNNSHIDNYSVGVLLESVQDHSEGLGIALLAWFEAGMLAGKYRVDYRMASPKKSSILKLAHPPGDRQKGSILSLVVHLPAGEFLLRFNVSGMVPGILIG